MDKLYPEQQLAHDNSYVRSRGGILFWKVGTGKTRVGLSIFATLQEVYKWPNPTICLFVCKPKCLYDIRKEIVKIGLDCVVLEHNYGVPDSVMQRMCEVPTILLVSHAMLSKMCEYFNTNPSIRMVILDDGYLFKNPTSAKCKAAYKLTLGRRGLIMSGSVMTHGDLCDVWGQAYAVNQHRRIAPNFTRFRSDTFHIRMEGYARKYPVKSPKKGAYNKIVDALGDCVSFYFPENSKRKIHEQIIELEATPEQDKLFNELREWFSAEDYNLELDYTLQVGQQIQRVSSGWITTDHGTPNAIENNKIPRLIDLVTEIVEGGERCVIWCAFVEEVSMVAKALPFATLQMSSRHDFDVNAWEGGNAMVVICTEASGVGFNHFEQVPYAIYFSMGWKWLDLQQSRGRTDREASKHNEVFYYYLHTIGGLDRRIYDVATSNENRELSLIQVGALKDWARER